MIRKSSKVAVGLPTRLCLWCVACEDFHTVNVPEHNSGQGPVWSWNQDYERPTIHPSIKVQSGHYAKDNPPGNCWCDLEERTGIKSKFQCIRCHSYVRDGQWHYLNDCSHSFAGQVVDLPDIPDREL